MKKILCAVAAVAAGAALADITSANIVGYSNRELTANFQEMSSGDFVGIAVQEFTLDELSMTGDDVEGSTLRFMLPSGEFKKAIWGEIWFDDDGKEYEDDPLIGWTDASNPEHPIHYTFKPGEGFFAKPSGVAVEPKLVSSGALYTSDATLARIGILLTANFQEITSNPMPGGILALDDIVMSGEDVEGTTLRYMLPSGEFKKAIWGEIWFDDDGKEYEDDPLIGWTDAANPEHPIHYAFKTGESYFVKPSGVAVNPYITYPNPLYVAPKD